MTVFRNLSSRSSETLSALIDRELEADVHVLIRAKRRFLDAVNDAPFTR